jgi:putative tryptophan/tyrosine transport system substrate-binding protein
MRRRDFIAALGVAPAMWPFTARAQRPATIPLIGYLDSSGLPHWYEGFKRGLNDLGYVQGQTIAIEHRSAAGQAERLPALAAELVSLQPKIIVASGSPAAVAARKVTATIPIVFTFATDPIGLGLVASLARPGGNITGQSNQGPGLVGKRLQLLAEMVPGVSRFGVVWTPSFTANHADFGEMQKAAATLRLELNSFEVTRPSDFDAAFKEAAARTSGAAVLSGPLIFTHRERVVAAAARHKVPAIYYDAEYAESGGLVSYGPSLVGLHSSAAVFVDKILKGEKPADLPVQQPTRFKLVVNMKAAKALGLTVPPTLLVRADEVIE